MAKRALETRIDNLAAKCWSGKATERDIHELEKYEKNVSKGVCERMQSAVQRDKKLTAKQNIAYKLHFWRVNWIAFQALPRTDDELLSKALKKPRWYLREGFSYIFDIVFLVKYTKNLGEPIAEWVTYIGGEFERFRLIVRDAIAANNLRIFKTSHGEQVTPSDLLKLAALHEITLPPLLMNSIRDELCVHSDDFHSVMWHGYRFTFTTKQAMIIQILWEHMERRVPEVTWDHLLENSRVRSSFKTGETRFRDVFKNVADIQKLIEKIGKNKHRLTEPYP